jgi:hypothetical protein
MASHLPNHSTLGALENEADTAPCTLDSSALRVARGRGDSRSVRRAPQNLRMHPALDGLNFIDVTTELNESVHRTAQPIPEPVLITTNGTLLAGFGRWRLAVFGGQNEIDCLEYEVSDEDSLQFILNHHQPRRGWNPFVRICAALTLKPSLQQKALDNMRAGGKYKGWANLPEASRLDVRKEIARIAGSGTRNVSNVVKILEVAHPRLTEALRSGTLTINGALQFCKFPKGEQLERFILHMEDRGIAKVIRRATHTPEQKEHDLDIVAVLKALVQQETGDPGSVAVRMSDSPTSVVLVGRDLMAEAFSQRHLKLT